MRAVLILVLTGLLASTGPPTASELRAGAQRFVATSGAPGAIVLYEQDGRRATVAAGKADVAANRRLRTSDRFWVGSITKTFVATAVLQLVSEGRLGLDDPVERLLPGRLPEGRRIRLRN